MNRIINTDRLRERLATAMKNKEVLQVLEVDDFTKIMPSKLESIFDKHTIYTIFSCLHEGVFSSSIFHDYMNYIKENAEGDYYEELRIFFSLLGYNNDNISVEGVKLAMNSIYFNVHLFFLGKEYNFYDSKPTAYGCGTLVRVKEGGIIKELLFFEDKENTERFFTYLLEEVKRRGMIYTKDEGLKLLLSEIDTSLLSKLLYYDNELFLFLIKDYFGLKKEVISCFQCEEDGKQYTTYMLRSYSS